MSEQDRNRDVGYTLFNSRLRGVWVWYGCRFRVGQAFQWVRASLGQPGLFVGPGRVHWAGLNFKWAWAGLGLEVPSLGDPVGLAHVLSLVSDFHDPSSHGHYGNLNLSTEFRNRFAFSRRVFKWRLYNEKLGGKVISAFNCHSFWAFDRWEIEQLLLESLQGLCFFPSTRLPLYCSFLSLAFLFTLACILNTK